MISDRDVQLPMGLMHRAGGGEPVPAVVVGAHQPVVMDSVKSAVEDGLIDPVLVGPDSQVRELAEQQGLSPQRFEIIDASGDKDIAFAAAERVKAGTIGMVVKGHVHTDVFMAALLSSSTGLRVSGQRMTHCFHMTVPDNDQALIITDGAVNIAPDQATKRAAILNAVSLAHAIGIEVPKVAILSATESALPQMPSSLDAAELTEWARDAVADAEVFGPLAFDNAVSDAAAQLKGIDHPVAGQADILLVPNIETGNALFKMMVYFLSACAAGVVLGGRIPIVLTSRADPPEARLASMALAKLAASTTPAS